MKTANLDCFSGISGDMTLGALVDAGVDLADIQQRIDSLGLPDCRLRAEEVKRCGFRALKIHVEHSPEHAHRHLHHITEMIDGSSLTPAQKELAKRIFTRLGEAEAKVHGTTIEKVHFHEVGAVDSIADIVASAVGWDLLGVDRIVASAVPTGTGQVRIAHGVCNVPAPATAELLTGVPLAESSVPHELTTPTGAALLATVVDSFGPLPSMKIRRIGYGAGQRDLREQPNVLRLLVGDAAHARPDEQVWVTAGDGGFQMNIQELATVVQEKLPIKMAILNNGYLGMVRQWQQLFFEGRYSGTPLLGPDFAKVAEAYGIPGLTVREKSEAVPAIAQAMATDGPMLIDFRIVQEENVYPMVAPGAPVHDMIRRPEPQSADK